MMMLTEVWDKINKREDETTGASNLSMESGEIRTKIVDNEQEITKNDRKMEKEATEEIEREDITRLEQMDEADGAVREELGRKQKESATEMERTREEEVGASKVDESREILKYKL